MGAAAENLSDSARMRVVTKADVERAARLEAEGVELEIRTPRVVLVDEDTGKERAVLVATKDGVFVEVVRYGERLLCPLILGEPVAVREEDEV